MTSNMRILLVRASLMATVSTVTPPLGVLWLSSNLKRRLPGSETRVLDLRIFRRWRSHLQSTIRTWKPDVVGISALSGEGSTVREIVAITQRTRPGTDILIGGPFATVSTQDAMDVPGFSALVRGEAEFTLPELLSTGIASRPEIQGVYYPGDDWSNDDALANATNDLDELGAPDWAAINLSDYKYVNQMNTLLAGHVFAHVMTSRGCPFRCAYCHNLMGRRVRFRSVSAVLQEIDNLERTQQVDEIHFVDDIFNFKRERVLEISKEMAARKPRMKIAFPNALRGDLLDKEQIDALKAAGCYMITFAIESGSERMQSMINKKLDLDRVLEMIAYARSKQIITKAYFIIGFPTETLSEIEQTVALARSSALNMASFFAYSPYENTPLYEAAVAEGIENPAIYQRDYYTDTSFYQAVTGHDLSCIQRKALRSFYSFVRFTTLFRMAPRPFYLIYQFARLSAWISFSRLIQAVKRLIFRTTETEQPD